MRKRIGSLTVVTGVLLAVALIASIGAGFAATPTDLADCLGNRMDAPRRTTACTAVIEDTRQASADRAIAYYNRGYAYRQRGDNRRAIRDLNEALRINPGYERAYTLRGNAYGDLGDFSRSIADHSQAIRLGPTTAVNYNNRGFYQIRVKLDLAIADFNEAIRLDPNYAAAYENRAYAFFLKRDYQMALADYTETLRLDPAQAGKHRNSIAEVRKRMQ